MAQHKICLASDNWAPAHPLILQSVIEANSGFATPYGEDHWTQEAKFAIQSAFNVACKVMFMPCGTGANILSLKLSCRRHESVICTDIAHIHYQESGAAESVVGCKLLTVPPCNGKLTKATILEKLKSERAFGKHSTSPRMISIAQPTEVGTVYTLAELEDLSELCKKENLLLHMDGSRIYNAAIYLNCSLGEIIQAASVDILSLGGTKNGLMSAEALLIFNPDLENGCDHLHKQSLQLLSKMRYLSAQYIPFFKEGLWSTLATQANKKALELAAQIKKLPKLHLNYPVETNQVFFTAPREWVPFFQENMNCYLWDLDRNEIRLIASWNTSEEDIAIFKTLVESLPY